MSIDSTGWTVWTLAQNTAPLGGVPAASTPTGAVGGTPGAAALPGSTTLPASEAIPLPGSGTAVVPGGAGKAPASGGGMEMMILMFGLLAFMIIMTLVSGRREKKKKAEMMTALHKGALVQTAGGMVGEIWQMRDGEDFVILQVEDGRIKVVKSAILAILKSREGAKADAKAEVESKPREVASAR
jgi:preprotein translocase subunit YajC